MSSPTFSVITVSYQHAAFIRQTIESVIGQEYPHVEHLIIDGGSTDGTLEILREYTHLKWISEPDRGQSHALNKGFARATGDIIAWLNSDDWLAPGAFNEVAEALEHHPIVLGACAVCNKEGVRQYEVTNYERTWFDLLKYWVYCSSPAQPSVFFRREILEEVKYSVGKYIDEDLEFCMDLDLWLRIAERYPLSRRVPKVLSHLRNYDTNKTGEMMDLTYREMGRVFQRYSGRKVQAEVPLSLVVPVQGDSAVLERSISSYKGLPSQSAEMLVVDYGMSPIEAKLLRRKVLEWAREVKSNTLRYVRSDAASVFGALNYALNSVRAPLMTVLQPGDQISPTWPSAVQRVCERDSVAFVPLYEDPLKEAPLFTHRIEQGSVFRPEGIFVAPRVLPNFVARTVALLELGGFKNHGHEVSPLIALRQLMLRLLYKGWTIIPEHALSLPQTHRPFGAQEELLGVFQLYINAQLIVDLMHEAQHEPFFKERLTHRFTLEFPPNLTESARKLLGTVGPDWPHVISHISDSGALQQWTARYPLFGPAWTLLERIALRNGDAPLAENARRGLERAQQALASL